ncbi:carboxypeptidase-like regulatory domain-containing protein [Aureibaculum sp. 2210JD6-5]|uniref:carboxypeptidase-like regulatory domain-containing protein n=1 Tax=Aureibaculum sp. 2210JD6-5 TaxID=3103957 RepID=UPI002AACE1BB|nr:carboxypeptidase-like regulatory domain-containing protein [Aureibaculum sp. 2210JD6-5]MDY7394630.1 carboxypeptidase-like regulatory domain-containing protein [Aureibaculum sp. 2210JD6-5]
MSKITLTLILFLLFTLFNNAQETGAIKGVLIDYDTQLPLENVNITISETSISKLTDVEGIFIIKNISFGDYLVEITHNGYEAQRYPITINNSETLNLGTIYLYRDNFEFNDSNQIVWNDDNPYENNQSYYSNSKDVFLKRVGFDFSPTFFSFRGYDAGQSKIVLNGIDMSNLYNNRPIWNTFSGLNDITRNRESIIGLSYSEQNYGGLSGTTFINAIPSEMRPGLRISSSFSNKNYVGSTMATYNSGLKENGLAYSISASRRWGNEGFVEATLYDAFSLFGAVSYQINDNHSINATAIYAPSRKGQTTAITERVFNEFGSSYNPYWGWQEGEKRNSSISTFKAPIFMIGHRFKNEKSTFSNNFSYQSVTQKNSRLDYTDAPNPYPNYWKYLPTITENPQIDWLSLYETNLNSVNVPDGSSARYLLYDHVKNDQIFTANSVLNHKLNKNLNFDVGVSFKNSNSINYATPKDLLGGLFFKDVNPFTIIDGQPSKNDLLGEENKRLGDKIKYNFDLKAHLLSAFTQLKYKYDKMDIFISANYTNTAFQRDGKFLNQSYENNSLGKSEQLTFNDFGLKAGVNYQILPNHSLQMNTAYLTKAPTIQNSFINIRENNAIVPNLVSEKIISADASYLINTPKLQSRLTGYITDFKDGTTVNSFFAEIGSGADFFQEVITNIDKRHLGLELGLEYEIIPNLSGSAVLAFGKHTYTNNANVGVNFDIADLSEDVINNTGFIDLGENYLKNYKVANGPQQAYSVGLFYKNPNDWWVNASGNYFSNGYLDISAITRTDGFFNNPNDYGQPFQDIDFDLARKLLKQEKFDSYSIVNLSAGKSWKFKRVNVKLVASIHNLFNVNYKSGGYEQSRTANYGSLVADTENGVNQRNFGPKYWYGFGRTYFINLAFSFKKKYKRYEDNN